MHSDAIRKICEKVGLNDSMQIGMLRKRCVDNGITSVHEIAEVCEALRQMQMAKGVWGYENYSENGSNSSGIVCSAATADLHKECVIWSINHYLGLNRHPEVIDAAYQALKQFGTGCGTSAISGGHNKLHKTLENRIAKIFKKDAAMLFSTGFTANVGVISTLGRNGKNVIFFDKECHASMIDGMRLAGCEYFPFKHNDVADLEEKLKTFASDYENVFVIVESVYSMSGEEAPLKEIAALKSKYKFYYYVDEAHAFGLYALGGLCCQLGISDAVDFIMTTLSKSVTSVGGVVACNREFITLLQAEATAYIFQAAMTPSDTAVVLKALDIIEREPGIVASLWKKTNYFRRALKERGFDTGKGTSPIVAVFIRDSDTLFTFSKMLLEKGIFTTAVTYPAVKQTEVRFRFIVNESHTYEQIDYTLEVLTSVGKTLRVL